MVFSLPVTTVYIRDLSHNIYGPSDDDDVLAPLLWELAYIHCQKLHMLARGSIYSQSASLPSSNAYQSTIHSAKV